MAVAILQQPREISFSRNQVFLSLQSSSYEQLENYAVEVTLFMERGSGSEEIVTLRDFPDGSGVTRFPIHEILHSELDNELTVEIPDPTDADEYILDNQRTYFLNYRERYGNPSEPQQGQIIDNKKVIFGATDEAAAPDFFDNIDATNSLWSGQPDGQRCTADVPKYLHWYNYTGATATGLQIEITETADNGASTQTKVLSASVEEAQTLVIPVGHAQLGLDAATKKYTVQLLDGGGTAVAPLRTYYVTQWQRECRERILWLNTFNAPETIELTGHTRTNLGIARSISERIATTNYSAIVPDRFQWTERATESYTFRSGYHSETQIIALREMLIINRLFRLEGNAYKPVLLTDSRYQITECFEFLHTLEFNAEVAKRSRAYTVRPEAVTDEECCCEDALEFGALGAITFANEGAVAFTGAVIG